MSSVAHTPIPWHRPASDPEHGAITVVGDALQMVCLVYGKNPDEQSANADLVIAGPELLAACKEAKELLVRELRPPGSTLFWKLVDVIAKAEGRS